MRAQRWGFLVIVAGAMLVIGACDTLGDAQQGIDRADLISDLSARLERAEDLTYTAEYQLAGGASATVAHARDPRRTAFTHPGGKLVIMPAAITDCRGAAGAGASCTVVPAPSPNAETPVSLLDTVGAHGMITPQVVAGLLTATAVDSDAAVAQSDTTIAGQHATCIRVDGVDNARAPSYQVCVTADGVIGRFSGTVNGSDIEIAMTRYRDTVATDAFEPPPGAPVVDQRSTS